MQRIDSHVSALLQPGHFHAEESTCLELVEHAQTSLRSQIRIYPIQKQQQLYKKLSLLLRTKLRQLTLRPNETTNKRALFIQGLLKVLPFQDYIPLCPYEACPEANVGEFFTRAITLYVHTINNWTTSEKVRYLSALVSLGITGHPICHSELGDCYVRLHSWDKASLCYALALEKEKSSKLELKLIDVATKRGVACNAKGITALSRSNLDTVQTIRLVSTIDDLSRRSLWLEALDIAHKGFDSSQSPVVFLQKIADIYLALSKQSSFVFFLQNFWSLAQRVVGRIGQAPDESWNMQSVKAVLSLVDYICAQHREAEQLLLFLTRNVPYKDSTLVAFLSHLNLKHDEISVLQIDADRFAQQLVERLIYQDFKDVSDRDEVTALFVDLREMFLGSSYQSIPMGLLHYVRQYSLFLQNILSLISTYPNQDQVTLFTPHFRSQVIRFTSLQDSLKETFGKISSVLSALYEWRNSRFASQQKEDPHESSTLLIAQGNLFTYIASNFVPSEHQENVTEYLNTHGITITTLLSSSLLSLVPNTHVVNPSKLEALTSFLKMHNIQDIASLRKFLLEKDCK